MASFCFNSAKTYVGKNVNLHLKDGAVIVNVRLTAVKKPKQGKKNMLEYALFGKSCRKEIPLKNVEYADELNGKLLLA